MGDFLLINREWLKDGMKNPYRLTAWLDFCMMADRPDHIDDGGQLVKRGEVVMSYSALAKRWEVSKTNVYNWVQQWIDHGRMDRVRHCPIRNAEQFIVYAYIEYNTQPAAQQPMRNTEPASWLAYNLFSKK